jgi:septum formation protein
MSPLVLASTSPFRRQLLARLGLEFRAVAPHTDERQPPGESPERLCLRLAEEKARSVASAYSNHLIIGSDQVAVLSGQVMGKPIGHEEAVDQLRQASGRTMTFWTALCLLNSGADRIQREVIPYRVLFRSLTSEQIERYLERDQPYQCAGAIRSEALGIALIERMEGADPTALVGLPLIALVTMLQREGVNIP